MAATVINNYWPILLIIALFAIVIIFNSIDIWQIIKKHTKGQRYNITEKAYIIMDIVAIVCIIIPTATGLLFFKYYIGIFV